jgi:uncharacterized membrane protein YhaH (DUF805 family)
MLGAIFSFRGRINRLQYFLASLGLSFGLGILLVGVMLAFIGSRGLVGLQQAVMPISVCFLFILPVFCWVHYSLVARRFRDMGWNPLYAILGWIGAGVVVALATRGIPSLALVGAALNLLIGFSETACLWLWPGDGGGDSTPAAAGWSAPPRATPAAGWSATASRASPSPASAPAAAWNRAPAPTGFGRRGL